MSNCSKCGKHKDEVPTILKDGERVCLAFAVKGFCNKTEEKENDKYKLDLEKLPIPEESACESCSS